MVIHAAIDDRDPSNKPADVSAVRALAQAAINVELFTVPLYMTTMYSIQGTHEINAAGLSFYEGRTWPGSAPVAQPCSANEEAFNVVFSVFIEEMLHLQLAANVAAVLGVQPTFTSPLLQSQDFGWIVYGPTKTVIPHIIDLRDTTTFEGVKVMLGALDHNQIELLLAIEEPEALAKQRIKPDRRDRYFPPVPFAGWTASKGEADLPLMGTIGYMYEALVEYLQIRYSDGTTLWDAVYTPHAVQRDLFNSPTSGHPQAEYPGFKSMVPVNGTPEQAFAGVVDIINAITDQGEGKGVSSVLQARLRRRGMSLGAVQPNYRSSQDALVADYPDYDALGKPARSADAAARFPNDAVDHYARFLEIKHKWLTELTTWPAWHAARGKQPWKAEDLLTGGPTTNASMQIPSARDVADALNRLQAQDVSDPGSVLRMLSQVAVGAIAGVTRVLDDYWQDPSVAFPFPSMGGSGDRVAICWATLGLPPDLSLGIEQPKQGVLYHACQALDLANPGSNALPDISTFHTCKGSNSCKGQGGCGFVQSDTGGGSCGASANAQVSCGGKAPSETLYSAPSDNKCGSFGGCAVPISASQLYPTAGTMQLFDIQVGQDSKPIGTLDFAVGDKVYDIAWQAYVQVLQSRGQPVPKEPAAAADLRVALPPST